MANILTIPNEITLKIFQILIDDSESPWANFPLMAVCRDWRNLIQQEAIFWQRITINEHSVLPRPLSSPEEIFVHAELAFKHSRDLPIDIIIEVPDLYKPCPWFTPLHTDMLAPVLRREANRIAGISIIGNDWEMHLSVLNGFHGIPMPLLHTFADSIWGYNDGLEYPVYNDQRISLSNVPVPILQFPSDDDNIDMSKVNAWGEEMYPNLQHINISGAPFNWRKLPTSGLKTLTVGHQRAEASPPFSLLHDLLSFAAPTLEELAVSGHFYPTQPPRPAILPNLTKLSITFKSPDEVTTFLPHIHTSALKELHLKDTIDRFNFGFAAWHEDICTDGMVRSIMEYLPLPQLEALIIEDVTFKDNIPTPSASSLRFLASLTSLKRLHLVEWGNFLQLLNYPGPYLPNLETLHVEGVVDDILRFLKDRVQMGIQRTPLYFEIGEMSYWDFNAQKREVAREMIKELAR